MKYFKFTQIDANTGISWIIKQPITGPSWPSIPGLTNFVTLSYNDLFHVAIVDDSAEANPENYFFELTAEEYAEELKRHVTYLLEQEKSTIYQQENNFRSLIFDKYHDTASIAGIYKYEQAKELIADNTAAAPDVRAEATARGITAVAMAERIIENHESFREKEAKIAGIRGKILDRIEAFEFDLEDPEASLAEFNTEETIGTRTEPRLQNGEMQNVDVDIKVRKYSLSMYLRFNHE